MSSFVASDPATWMDYLSAFDHKTPPAAGDPVQAYEDWNLGIGHVVTDDTLKVRAAITQTQRRNRLAPLTARGVVIVDGSPFAGKTSAVMQVALEQTRQAWAEPPPHEYAYSLRPWLYVEVQDRAGAASIASGLVRQIGAPLPRGRNRASDHVRTIREHAPKIALQGYIVDDTHGMHGARSSGYSTTLSTSLKGLITGLPGTAVIVGADLARDGVFAGTAGEQISLSCRFPVTCGQWQFPTDTNPTGWHRLVRALKDKLAFPGGARQFQLGRLKAVQALAEGSLGRPGLAIDWVKEAAVYAVANETSLDLSALQATHACVQRQLDAYRARTGRTAR